MVPDVDGLQDVAAAAHANEPNLNSLNVVSWLMPRNNPGLRFKRPHF